MPRIRAARSSLLLTLASAPQRAGFVIGFNVTIQRGDCVHARAAAGFDIALVVADIYGLFGSAAQLCAVAQQGLRVWLAFAYIVRADQAADGRLYVKALHQGSGKGARFVGRHAPGDAALGQRAEQCGNAGIRLGATAQHVRVQGEQTLSLGLEFRVCFYRAKGECDQGACAVGHARADTRGLQWWQPIFGAQCLHHHDEFAGGIDQGAVQVEQHRAQVFRAGRAHAAGLLARSM